jgi:hypothetical protein
MWQGRSNKPFVVARPPHCVCGFANESKPFGILPLRKYGTLRANGTRSVPATLFSGRFLAFSGPDMRENPGKTGLGGEKRRFFPGISAFSWVAKFR